MDESVRWCLLAPILINQYLLEMDIIIYSFEASV